MSIDLSQLAERPTARELVSTALYRTGALRLCQHVGRHYEVCGSLWSRGWRRTSYPKWMILCYHRVGTGGVPIYSWLERDIFEAQIRYLRTHYPIVSLDEIAQGLTQTSGNERGVAITFDDGYRDTYLQAFPVLRKYRVPATVYLTVDAVESGQVSWYDRLFLAFQVASDSCLTLPGQRSVRLGSAQARLQAAEKTIRFLRTLPEERRRAACEHLEGQVVFRDSDLAGRMLSWEQIREMHSEGIDFGSHTLTHPVLSRLNNIEIDRELGKSKEILEQRIGATVRHFAYPFGNAEDIGTYAVQAVGRLGYCTAVTACLGVNGAGSDPYRLARIGIGPRRSLGLFSWRIESLFLNARWDASPISNRVRASAGEN